MSGVRMCMSRAVVAIALYISESYKPGLARKTACKTDYSRSDTCCTCTCCIVEQEIAGVRLGVGALFAGTRVRVAASCLPSSFVLRGPFALELRS